MRFTLLFVFMPLLLMAQDDSLTTNQDAIYNRPFIGIGETRTAVGGYLEGNTNYFVEDGITEGFSMEMRRFNIFLYSQIATRIRFLSELEFEHGTEEIALETAILDFQLNPAFNVRGGIILPAIGITNTNHDSPNWEFVERSLSSTNLIPTTLSEIGFGAYGKFYPDEKSVISYDAYITNGLQDGVILNPDGRTNLSFGKSPEMFAEDNNGEPMYNARLAYSHRKVGEFGLGYYGGVYNTYQIEGDIVDDKRRLSITALDYNFNIGKLEVKGEGVLVNVDVPADINEQYGETQYGGFVDLIYPVLKRRMLKFDNAVLNVSLRGEYADYNVGEFETNIQTNKGDENKGIAVGVGFRPQPGTIFRVNYRYHWITDVLGNPPARMAGLQVGIASYF